MKRILFVDDEVNMLRSLQRMLRDMRREWEMVFVESGEAALRELAGSPFDVVVADVRMPGMTGLELLRRVRGEYPAVVRIILSGHFDQDAALGAVRLAHQSLYKPCQQDELKATIRRAFVLQNVLLGDEVKIVAAEIERLPSLPALYNQVIQQLSSPDASMKKIGDLISMDIAMTAKMLQIVNSAYFGLRRQITTPAEAVVYMGLEQIKALVLSLHIFSHAQLDGFSDTFLNDLWEHSFATGVLAREIAQARSTDRVLIDAAFTAGVLHDVGKIVFASNYPQVYGDIIRTAKDDRRCLHEIERDHFRVTHTEIGAYLLSIWGLPEKIVEAVLFHHHPSRCADDRFSALAAVHVANHFSSKGSFAGQGIPTTLDLEYLDRVGLGADLRELERLAARVRATVR